MTKKENRRARPNIICPDGRAISPRPFLIKLRIIKILVNEVAKSKRGNKKKKARTPRFINLSLLSGETY
jgi:hypothetical protein